MKHILKFILLVFWLGFYFKYDIHAQKMERDTLNLYGKIKLVDWKERGFMIGANVNEFLYGDLGYYRGYVWEKGSFPIVAADLIYGLEFSKFDKFDDWILAPKLQGRFYYNFVNVSFAGMYYSNLDNWGKFHLRPEIGVGLWNVDINYGYNYALTHSEVHYFSEHIISLRYYLRTVRKNFRNYTTIYEKD